MPMMHRPHTAPRRALRPPLATALAAALATLTGCGGRVTTSTEPFQGPAMRMTEVGGLKVVEVQSPSPGWRVAFNRSRPALNTREVMVTLHRPDPQFVYPQVIVDQNIVTDVPAGTPTTLFARILPHNDRRRSGVFNLVTPEP